MIPGPYVAVVLALAVFRCCRLAGWDDLPILERARGWLTGAHEVTSGSSNARMGVTSETVEREIAYHRPLVAKLLGCPYCLGLYLSAVAYAAWYYEPRVTLIVLFPLALSAAAGITARMLDP